MTFKVDSNLHPIRTATNSDPYQLTSTDFFYIAQNGQTINLPDPTISSVRGRCYYIKLGATHTSDVTIQCVHGPTTYNIDGSVSDTITRDYGVVGLIAGYNPSGNPQWFLIQHIDKNL
jgi:hypothetical protein